MLDGSSAFSHSLDPKRTFLSRADVLDLDIAL